MKKTKIVAIALGCMIFLLSGCNNAEKEKQERFEQEYGSNLNQVSTEMLIGTTYSETLCNKTSSVWYDAINKEINTETLKYTFDSEKKEFVDFSTAIQCLYADEATVATVDLLKENKQKVDDLMSELATPPEKYTVCYSTITDLYKTYSSFASIAISPSGSYKEYTEKVSKLDSDFGSTYDLVKTQLPDLSSLTE